MALVNKTFSDIITFTRASTGTFFNSAGVLTSAAINAPRFDYNPATLAAQGLLIEEQRTNLFQRSEEFNDAYWTPLGSTVTANSTTAPTNTNVADTLIEDTSTGEHRIGSPTIAWIGNTQYTATFFAKASGRTRFDLLLGTVGNWVNGERVAQFDISNGTVSAPPGAPAVASIQSIGNGWYRCRITATTTAAPTASGVFIRLCDATGSASYTGNGTSGIFLFGAQVEAGGFPTSYIPTTTTALTRSADVASVNTLSPWFNATEGTLFTETSAVGLKAIGAQYHATIGTSGSNEIRNRYVNALNGAQIHQTSAGETFSYLIAASANTVYKTALAYKTNDSQAAINGVASSVDTSVTLPTGMSVMYVGMDTGSGAQLNGYLRRLTYYPRRLSNAELQAITA